MYAVVFHAHQKIDKVAYRQLKRLLPADSFFPGIKQIVYFDGKNGPDSTKLKRHESVEQPWHFINPKDKQDTTLEKQIEYHYTNLVTNLRAKDEVRSGFEAAWLAHALVDGLTPAHHYPYEQELEVLRGESRTTRHGLIDRAFVHGETISQSLAKSLKIIGPKGLLTTHAMFEAGAYFVIAPLKLTNARPTKAELDKVVNDGVIATFRDFINQVVSFELYSRFYATGWTVPISQDVRKELAPRMVKMVTLAWYAASQEAKA